MMVPNNDNLIRNHHRVMPCWDPIISSWQSDSLMTIKLTTPFIPWWLQHSSPGLGSSWTCWWFLWTRCSSRCLGGEFLPFFLWGNLEDCAIKSRDVGWLGVWWSENINKPDMNNDDFASKRALSNRNLTVQMRKFGETSWIGRNWMIKHVVNQQEWRNNHQTLGKTNWMGTSYIKCCSKSEYVLTCWHSIFCRVSKIGHVLKTSN